jgi:hypothetical protein
VESAEASTHIYTKIVTTEEASVRDATLKAS